MDFIVIPLLAAVAYFGVQSTATVDRVVLLPDANGKVGALIVKSARGEELLNTAYASAHTNGFGALVTTRSEPSPAISLYGQTLAALPSKPASFTVYFVSGSDTDLTPESRPVLAQIKAELANRPAPEIVVIGHTDRVGTLEANDALSIRRARNVRDILAAAGLQDASLEVAGRGEREPLVPTADDVPEEKNRRVEISVR